MKLNFVTDKPAGRKSRPSNIKSATATAVADKPLKSVEEPGIEPTVETSVQPEVKEHVATEKATKLSLGSAKKRTPPKIVQEEVSDLPQIEEAEVVPTPTVDIVPAGGITLWYTLSVVWALIICTVAGFFLGARVLEFIYSLGVL